MAKKMSRAQRRRRQYQELQRFIQALAVLVPDGVWDATEEERRAAAYVNAAGDRLGFPIRVETD